MNASILALLILGATIECEGLSVDCGPGRVFYGIGLGCVPSSMQGVLNIPGDGSQLGPIRDLSVRPYHAVGSPMPSSPQGLSVDCGPGRVFYGFGLGCVPSSMQDNKFNDDVTSTKKRSPCGPGRVEQIGSGCVLDMSQIPTVTCGPGQVFAGGRGCVQSPASILAMLQGMPKPGRRSPVPSSPQDNKFTDDVTSTKKRSPCGPGRVERIGSGCVLDTTSIIDVTCEPGQVYVGPGIGCVPSYLQDNKFTDDVTSTNKKIPCGPGRFLQIGNGCVLDTTSIIDVTCEPGQVYVGPGIGCVPSYLQE